MKKKIRKFCVFCIPVFIILMLYTQMSSSKIVESYNNLHMISGVTDVVKDYKPIGVGAVVIPFVGASIEAVVVPTLNYTLMAIEEKYSPETALKIYTSMYESFTEYIVKNDTIYLHQYNQTVLDMINLYLNRAQFGKDAELTVITLTSLKSNLNTMNLLIVFKYLLLLILLVLSVIGFFMNRVNRIDKLMYEQSRYKEHELD